MKTALMRIARSLLLVCLLLYGAAMVFLYTQQDSILFFPRPVDEASAAQHAEHALEIRHDGVTLRGWFFESNPDATDTLVFYGGNGDELSRAIDNVVAINSAHHRETDSDASGSTAQNYNYLLINYRGYGDSEGAPGESELKSDAVFILQTLADQNRINLDRTHIIGRSLGSGVATHVAAQLDLASLILVTPYDSIQAVAQGRYPIFPIGLLIRHPFASIDYTDAIDEPTLIIKAQQDTVVPHPRTDALISAWQSPLRIVTLAGTDHNNIYSQDFYHEISMFLAEH